MAPSATAANSQVLSAKENALYRTISRCYDEKQYKRGIKSADLLLKKNPKHGETMALKAMTLSAMGKLDEALVLSKEAVTANMKSHTCWQIYGEILRSSRQYEESAKAFKFALKLNPSHIMLYRELACLQVHTRDFAGFIQSRHELLQNRSNVRQNWTALAIAHHLAGELTEAERILSMFEGTLKATPSRGDVEHAEAVMYKNRLIAEQGDYERALEHLEKEARHGLDRLAVLEARAEYHSKLGHKTEAAKAYRALISRNPDYSVYYLSLLKELDIADDDQVAKKAIFDEYASKFPRCDVPKRLPLDFLTDDAFAEAAEKYLNLMLDKGIPSTFANLKHLYNDKAKKDVLLSVAKKYLESSPEVAKVQSKDFNPKDDQTKGRTAALYYLAQHYNYHLSRDLDLATEYINQAIDIIPNNVAFQMTKARILKHHGDNAQAAEVMDGARKLDLNDRYINSKAGKYLLRNNQNEKALKTIGMFTRPDVAGGPLADLNDMQCWWFMMEDGEAYVRQGMTSLALKRFHTVFGFFDSWSDDAYDFHSFTLRKAQYRAYVDMIKWEETIWQHPIYKRLALNAIKVYLGIYDSSIKSQSADDSAEETAEYTKEKKRLAKNERKEQERLEKDIAEDAAKRDPNKGGRNVEPPVKVDKDPVGAALAATKDPLAAATKFLGPLLQSSPEVVETQLIAFEVFMRREKYLLALKCLNHAISLDPTHPDIHEQTFRLQHKLNSVLSSLPDKVIETIKAEFKSIDQTADLKKLNEEFYQENKSNPTKALAAIKTKKVLGEDKAQCAQDIVGLLKLADIKFENAVAGLETLKSWRSLQTEPFRKEAAEKWPSVTAFKAQ